MYNVDVYKYHFSLCKIVYSQLQMFNELFNTDDTVTDAEDDVICSVLCYLFFNYLSGKSIAITQL